jgi:hypothetical protein
MHQEIDAAIGLAIAWRNSRMVESSGTLFDHG